ncbi:MAG: 3'(2'),5'-bisphosphate nucleotidase CysQ [Candidatus Omnitrophota bacterium]
MAYDARIVDLLKLADHAGRLIMEVYGSDFKYQDKADGSPVTAADHRSYEAISSGLARLYPDIPLLSEEGKEVSHSARAGWNKFWLVDPLDGTKEFIQKLGQFTVNIALVEDCRPVLGIVHAPARGSFYFAAKGMGAYRICGADLPDKARDIDDIMARAEKLPLAGSRKGLIVIASRSHAVKETQEYIDSLKKEFGEPEITNIGSALKLCLVAEGAADLYPRFGPTMEWDVGAGQIVVEETGGAILSLATRKPLEYNKESLVNPRFLVVSGGMARRLGGQGRSCDYLLKGVGA